MISSGLCFFDAFPISFTVQNNKDFGPLRRGQINFSMKIPGQLSATINIEALATKIRLVLEAR
jgi:hypothetical protein